MEKELKQEACGGGDAADGDSVEDSKDEEVEVQPVTANGGQPDGQVGTVIAAAAEKAVRLAAVPRATTDRARRLDTRARAAGTAAAALPAEPSPAVRLTLAPRSAEAFAAQTKARQETTQGNARAPAAVHTAERAQTLALSPGSATPTLDRARRLNTRARAAGKAAAAAPRGDTEPRPAVKHHMLSDMAGNGVAGNKRRRRVTWRMQEAMEDPQASSLQKHGFGVIAQAGAQSPSDLAFIMPGTAVHRFQ